MNTYSPTQTVGDVRGDLFTIIDTFKSDQYRQHDKSTQSNQVETISNPNKLEKNYLFGSVERKPFLCKNKITGVQAPDTGFVGNWREDTEEHLPYGPG